MKVSYGRRVAVTLAAVLVLTACGTSRGGGKKAVANTGTTYSVDAKGVQHVRIDGSTDDRFDPSSFTVHPGRVDIELHNTGGAPHDLTFADPKLGSTGTVESGGTARLRISARATGHYPFVCEIHVRQGMTGTMIVKAR
ncbi:MAG: cupredoxin domain-containing protein [Mycobacteriales bacterium]